MAGKFELLKGKDKKHYFRLKATNGETILQSQGYKSRTSCLNGIESVRRNAVRDGGVEPREGKAGKHYFVVKATNGQVIGTSESYSSSAACTNGLKSVAKNAPTAKLVE